MQTTVDAADAGREAGDVVGSGMPVAIIRNGQRVAFDDLAFGAVEAGDVIVSIRSR